MLAAKLEFIKDSCEVLLIEAEYEGGRVRSLIQVVSNLLNHEVNEKSCADG
jgi:hypothetical protein